MKRGGLYFIVDESNTFCGLTDRLKAVVGLYWIACQNGVKFKFIHKAGFDIRDYLTPNKVSWSAELSDINPFPWKRQSIRYFPPFDDIPPLSQNKQYICKEYSGKNVIEMRHVPEWEKIWRDSFNNLFTPSEKVMEAIKNQVIPDRYAVVNVRFINSLGYVENTAYNSPLPEVEQFKLIDAVLRKVADCQERSEVPIIVYSDSVTFLKIAEENGFRICDPAGVGNIMNMKVSDYVILMTFVYFFQMARASKIISILNLDGLPSNSLYKSQYPRYAAIVGNVPFERI